MRFIFAVLLSFVLLSGTAHAAGRSGKTTITLIVVKTNVVEFFTVAHGGGACTTTNRWHLLKTHSNYEVLVSGLLTAKTAGTEVDISGNGTCNGSGEELSWAVIAY